MKKSGIIKYILLYIFVFLLSLSVTSTSWAINKFAFLSFDETLFQLTTPIKSAESSIITTYLTDSFCIALLDSIIIYIMIIFITKKVKKLLLIFLKGRKTGSKTPLVSAILIPIKEIISKTSGSNNLKLVIELVNKYFWMFSVVISNTMNIDKYKIDSNTININVDIVF